MIKKLLLYFTLRAGSLFANRKEATVTLLLLAIISFGLYVRQDIQDKTLLRAAVDGDTELIENVVQRGAYIATTDPIGRTALHLAARYSNADAVRQLLEMGADIHALDERGRTALHISRFDNESNYDTIRILLEYGADPFARDNRGQTPLDIAEKSVTYNRPAKNLLRKAMEQGEQATQSSY